MDHGHQDLHENSCLIRVQSVAESSLRLQAALNLSWFLFFRLIRFFRGSAPFQSADRWVGRAPPVRLPLAATIQATIFENAS